MAAATAATAATATATATASPTLYVGNLSDQLKVADLRRTLFMTFTAHGKVLDVVMKRRDGMRGQAFIVFEDVQAATTARRREDGRVILGKPMSISFARSKSHATILAEDGPERLFQIRMGLSEADVKGKKLTVSSAQNALDAATKRERELDGEEDEDEEDETDHAAKRRRLEAPDEDAMEEEDSADEVDAVPLQPHHILLAKDLPNAVTIDMLNVLFGQYPGFQRVVYNSAKHDALIHYEAWQLAGDAREALDGFLLAPGVNLAVAFAPR